MTESILEQIYRQEREALQMIGMKPEDRPEYLRLTARMRESLSQNELLKLQRIPPNDK